MKRAGLLAIPALLLLCLAGWALVQEANPFLAGSGPISGRINTMIGGSRVLGLSSSAQNAFLFDCLAGVPSLEARMLAPALATRLKTRCRQGAESVIAATPVNSFAWAALADLARLDGDLETMNSALVMSQAIGPSELWIAERRVDIAEANYANLSAEAIAANTADLRVVASSYIAVRSVALRYLVRPDFRDRITAIVETLPPHIQSRFIANVNAVMRGAPQR